ncbi:hypothetical protein D3C80_2033340 [compost metagenome]
MAAYAVAIPELVDPHQLVHRFIKGFRILAQIVVKFVGHVVSNWLLPATIWALIDFVNSPTIRLTCPRLVDYLGCY